MPPPQQYFSTSLEKGLKILSLFNKDTPRLTQTDISKALDLNMTSTYRYINTFVNLGYLEKDEKTKELRPGFRCLTLCTALISATDNLYLIKQQVDKIYSQHNVTIDVVFVMEDTLMRVYHREAEETLTYQAFLSTLTESELEQTLDRIDLHARTKKTISDKDQLLSEIERTRKRGYAMSVEEYLVGLITIGAPLISPHSGEGIGAVSFDFSILQNSADEIEENYAVLIKKMAAALSKRLHR
jgi:DNA-binding IclR family transcriptional regulator